MIEIYKKFKHWVEQKNVQRGLDVILIVILIVIVSELFLVENNSNVLGHVLGVSKSIPTPTSINVIPSGTPTPEVIIFNTPTPVPQQNYQQYQQRTQKYQNYGWYWHSGQSMQYIDGNWYNTPQQAVTPTPYQQYGSKQTNSSSDPIMTCVLSTGTYQLSTSACQMYQEADLNSQDNALRHFNGYVPPPPTLAPPPQFYVPQVPNGHINLPVQPAPTSSCHWVCTSDSNCMQICN